MHVEFLVKNPAEIYSMHDLPQIFARMEQWGVCGLDGTEEEQAQIAKMQASSY